jgi:ABC-type glycerol-3-phosphate transport system substrate-binding protein
MLRTLRETVSGCCLVVGVVALVSCAPKPKEPATITYAAGDLPREQQALVREAIAAFGKEFPHIHVEPKFERYDPRAGDSGTGPDVFLASADDLPMLVEKDLIVDITPQITLDKTLLDPHYPEIVAACKQDSRQYLMPVRYNVDVLFYNQDLLLQLMREHKMAVNLQELDWEAVPLFAKPFVKREDDRIERYAMARPRPLLLIQAWGASPFAWNEVIIRNDHTRKALEYFLTVAREELVPGPDSTEANTSDMELFKQQKVVFFVGSSEQMAEADQIKEFKWDIAPAPKGPKRMQPGMPTPGSMEPPQPVEVWPRYGRMAVAGNAVWINTPRFAAAWEFMRFVSSEPGQRILARVRNGVPSIKVVAEGTEFLRQPPGHVDVLISSKQHCRADNMHSLVFFDEFCQQAFGPVTDQLLGGKLTVEQAIDEMDAAGRSLMEAAKAKKR